MNHLRFACTAQSKTRMFGQRLHAASNSSFQRCIRDSAYSAVLSMSGETLFEGLLVRFARIRKHIAAPAVGVALTLAVASLVGCGSGSTQVERPRTIHFSGYTWRVRSNPRTRLGPGPNYFSDSVSNVSVDSQGRLHLKLTHSHGRRYSASVISKDAFGYRRYTFELGSPVDALDPHV